MSDGGEAMLRARARDGQRRRTVQGVGDEVDRGHRYDDEAAETKNVKIAKKNKVHHRTLGK